MLTPLAVDPWSPNTVVHDWLGIEHTLGAMQRLVYATTTRNAHIIVYLTRNHAVKAMCHYEEEPVRRQLRVATQINALNNPAFATTHGYLVCSDPPPGVLDRRLEAGLLYEDRTKLNYVYLVMERFDHALSETPRMTGRQYANGFFQLLRGLAHARQALRLYHGNLVQETIVVAGSRFFVVDFERSLTCDNVDADFVQGNNLQLLCRSDVYALAVAFVQLQPARIGATLDGFLFDAILDQAYYSSNGRAYYEAHLRGQRVGITLADMDNPAKLDAYENLLDQWRGLQQ